MNFDVFIANSQYVVMLLIALIPLFWSTKSSNPKKSRKSITVAGITLILLALLSFAGQIYQNNSARIKDASNNAESAQLHNQIVELSQKLESSNFTAQKRFTFDSLVFEKIQISARKQGFFIDSTANLRQIRTVNYNISPIIENNGRIGQLYLHDVGNIIKK